MTSPRRGLVLGAGGVLGASWSVGALTALEELAGVTSDSHEVIVGTSAGAVLGSFLARGVHLEELIRGQHGVRAAGDPAVACDYDASSALPPSPRWGTVGSPRVLAGAARHPRSISAATVVSAMLPVGRGSLAPIRHLVGAERSWPEQPELWVVATDFETGRRTVFGREGGPPASLSEAVMASCAIPAWYRPMEVGGRRYVDGGACSATSADLLASRELDEVYVFAPMASFELDCPSSALARIERQLRRATTRRLQREIDKLRAGGTKVIVMAPGPEDLAAIGANMMDPRRRDEVLAVSLRTSPASLRGILSKEQHLPAAG